MERIPIYTDSLVKEIELYGAEQEQKPELKTLYFGGGTPNLFGMENFRKVMTAIRSYFNIESLEEFTMEINPGVLRTAFLKAIKSEGVNRISLGCQSYHNTELKTLGRIHFADDIDKALAEINNLGINAISLDFIYGIPGQTLAHWQKTLEKAVRTGATHLSLYCLSYEPGTPLDRARISGVIKPIGDEAEWQMYQLAHEILDAAGFVHYEISNWAKPGFEAKHNSVYWKGGIYLGLGPAAHSFDGKRRWWNIRSVDDYISALKSDRLPVEGKELLSTQDKIAELTFLGLRTKEGLDVGKFEELSGVKFAIIQENLLKKLSPGGDELIFRENGSLKLTPRGWFICDSIVANILSILEEIKR